MKERFYKQEIIRATKNIVNWIKKGNTPEEAFAKAESSYGPRITYAVVSSLNRVLSK